MFGLTNDQMQFYKMTWFNKICWRKVPEDLKPILKIMENDISGKKCRAYIDHNKLFYIKNGEGCHNQLMLRLLKNEIVVAKIILVHRREGKFTELMEEIEKLAAKNGVFRIGIESCFTDAICSWAEKNNFIVEEHSILRIERESGKEDLVSSWARENNVKPGDGRSYYKVIGSK